MGVRPTTSPAQDEASIVAAAKRGSEDAWRHLVEAHQERLMRLAWRLTGQRELAAELAQDAFVEAFVRIKQLRDDGAFGHWIRTILVRAARRTWGRSPNVADVELVQERTPQQEAIGRELREAADEAIASLSPIYREALALAMEGGLKSAEAAKLLGCSPEAYRVRVHKARRAVQDKLKDFLME
ncbi:RNA polymerase sigma factor [Planctomycetota bacterium]